MLNSIWGREPSSTIQTIDAATTGGSVGTTNQRDEKGIAGGGKAQGQMEEQIHRTRSYQEAIQDYGRLKIIAFWKAIFGYFSCKVYSYLLEMTYTLVINDTVQIK